MNTRITASFLLLFVGACGGGDTKGSEGDTTSTPSDTSVVTTTAPDATPDTSVDTSETTTCASGAACDDGDPCTIDDACDASGACVGHAKCDDHEACTTDSCVEGTCTNALLAGFCLGGASADVCVATNGVDPANTCRKCVTSAGASDWQTLADTTTCNDGDLCTTHDTCQGGTCQGGAALECPSDTPCVARTCQPALGCVDSDTTASCDDGDPCTVGDGCVGGDCHAGATPADCDDDNPCTIDSCQPNVGCVHDAKSKCDDGQPCTNDLCDISNGACSHSDIAAGDACEDGDPCTVGETCDSSHQCGDSSPRSCEDNNECTIDVCSSERGGCLNLFKTEGADGGPPTCDDGYECTVDDVCVAGTCLGAKISSLCELCAYDGSDHANKIVSLDLTADGFSGSGLDIDDDPATCAPENQCSGGVDNALAVLASLMNDALGESIGGGVVKWVVDLEDAKTDGSAFAFSIYDSGLIAADANCDFENEKCSYDTAPLSFGPDCVPYFRFEGVKIQGNKLTGGGQGQLISMVLPLASGSLLTLTIANAKVESTLTFDVGGKITSMNGVFGGAIPKSQLLAAIAGLSQDDLPIDRDTALQILDTIVVPDIDLDNDGNDEAASLAMRFRTIPAIIVPAEP